MSFISPSSRYRLYFDETGNGDLHAYKKDPGQRFLSLTGIVIRQDHHDNYTTRRLDKLKRDIFGTSDIILHRRDIKDRKGAFSVLDNPLVRAQFDARLAAIIAEVPTPAFTVTIDKQEHSQKYKVWHHSPYHYAMVCLLERFVLWLNRTDRIGDVMGEARNPTPDGKLRRAYRHFYDKGTTVRVEVIQKRLTTRELKLAEKSENIAGLQLADGLAHPAHRTYKFEKTGTEIPNDYGALLASILVQRVYDRKPKTGEIEGYGRKWLP
jgi:hypothetical protein